MERAIINLSLRREKRNSIFLASDVVTRRNERIRVESARVKIH